jgi:hypothetical protein
MANERKFHDTPQLLRDRAGVVHESAGTYNINSLAVCELGTSDFNLGEGIEQVYDLPVTCLRCVGAR